jgi:hypothetical protein
MEALRTSETSVYFNKTSRRYIPEGCHIYKNFALVSNLLLWKKLKVSRYTM